MAVQTKLRGRRQWTSLTVLAGAASAASPVSALAAIISHGPALLPISLPGGDKITLSRGERSATVTDNISIDNGTLRWSFRSRSFSAAPVGVNFAPFLAHKGQTFDQIHSGTPLAAHQTVRTLKVGGSARINASHPSFSTAVQVVLNRMAYATRNIQFSFFGPVSHQTGLKASGSKISTNVVVAPYTDQYALFRFDVGPQTDYGWLELSLSYAVTGEPDFTIDGYAYDPSGDRIRAGEVPEPQDLPLAMSALALGALGMREWRKGRRKPDA